MMSSLEAMTEASPYKTPKGAQVAWPANPVRGTVFINRNPNRPKSHWAVSVYVDDAWVCIGHGQECWQQAADRQWALDQADMLSVGQP